MLLNKKHPIYPRFIDILKHDRIIFSYILWSFPTFGRIGRLVGLSWTSGRLLVSHRRSGFRLTRYINIVKKAYRKTFQQGKQKTDSFCIFKKKLRNKVILYNFDIVLIVLHSTHSFFNTILSLFLTLSGPRFFRYRKDRGWVDFPPPPPRFL